MVLSEKDFIKINEFPRHPITIGNRTFYTKLSSLMMGFMEVLVSKIARDIFKLNTPNIYLVESIMQDNYYYLISEDLNKDGNFVVASDILRNNDDDTVEFSLYQIWFRLEEKFSDIDKTSLRLLIYKIVKMYLLGVFLDLPDCHSDNWGIIKKGDEVDLAVFDFELALSSDYLDLRYISSYYDDEYWRSIFQDDAGLEGRCDYQKEKQKIINAELLHFIASGSEEYKRLFLTLYDIMNVDNFKKIVDDVSHNFEILNIGGRKKVEIDFKDTILKRYKKNYGLISEVKEMYEKSEKNGRR